MHVVHVQEGPGGYIGMPNMVRDTTDDHVLKAEWLSAFRHQKAADTQQDNEAEIEKEDRHTPSLPSRPALRWHKQFTKFEVCFYAYVALRRLASRAQADLLSWSLTTLLTLPWTHNFTTSFTYYLRWLASLRFLT